jgi:WhiB family redox-sensing transcriptional regulator
MSIILTLRGALCAGIATADYDPFFPETSEDEAEALAMCHVCPVREECLKYAVRTGQLFGVWGGKTQAEIRRMITRAHAGHPLARHVPPGHFNADKTHCKHGHPFDAANTYYAPNGERRCRACLRDARIAWARGLVRRTSGGEC